MQNFKNIENDFETFYKLVEWFGLVPKNIWNIHKMGFKIGYTKAQKVITNNASKILVIIYFDNWKYITSIKSIDKVGCTILIFLILQNKYILYK